MFEVVLAERHSKNKGIIKILRFIIKYPDMFKIQEDYMFVLLRTTTVARYITGNGTHLYLSLDCMDWKQESIVNDTMRSAMH